MQYKILTKKTVEYIIYIYDFNTEFIMLNLMNKINHLPCSCGKTHSFDCDIYVGKGAVENLGDALKKYNSKKVFVFADVNTYKVGGKSVGNILDYSKIPYSVFVFDKSPKPDEHAVGAVALHCPKDADTVIAIGSGVLNDIGKILTAQGNKTYMTVATAPSMDGYVSTSSSMCRDGLKVTISSKSPEVIIGDSDILKTAPKKMMISGIGDMLAKYVSICEWRISNLLTGEYYCEEIANLTRLALKSCLDTADGLLSGDEDAVLALFRGLLVGSAAMNYAGISRPASGVEHYISHVIDMRYEEFGTPCDFHGIQCAIGTYISVKLYEKLKSIIPDYNRGVQYAESFDLSDWNSRLRSLLGKGAESMIKLEETEGKYDINKHASRLPLIIKNWNTILSIMEEELPKIEYLDSLYEKLGIPKSTSNIGTDESLLPEIFRASKDIRDKYVLPRLLWDLGILDEFANSLN